MLKIQNECGRVRGWLLLRGRHNFISLKAPQGHNPALCKRPLHFNGMIVLHHELIKSFHYEN